MFGCFYGLCWHCLLPNFLWGLLLLFCFLLRVLFLCFLCVYTFGLFDLVGCLIACWLLWFDFFVTLGLGFRWLLCGCWMVRCCWLLRFGLLVCGLWLVFSCVLIVGCLVGFRLLYLLLSDASVVWLFDYCFGLVDCFCWFVSLLLCSLFFLTFCLLFWFGCLLLLVCTCCLFKTSLSIILLWLCYVWLLGGLFGLILWFECLRLWIWWLDCLCILCGVIC